MSNNTLLKKAVSLISAVLCTLMLFPVCGVGVDAMTYAETVNLAYVKMNESGNGYYWDNINKVLTLDNISIDTDDDFGIRLPDIDNVVTVELKGTNRIKAGKYALGCPGKVRIKGNGELILESDEAAIFVHSRNDSHKFSVFSGKVTASGGKHAIRSEVAEIVVTGGTVELSSGSGCAVLCRAISVTGGNVSAKGQIYATHRISINESEVEVSCEDGAALKSDNLFTVENAKILAGNDSSSLSEVESYGEEKYFTAVPVPSGPRDSILFGEGTPITVDYILLAAALILVAAAIAVPYVRKRIKTKKLYESLEAKKAEK